MNGFQEALGHACAIAGVDADGARLLRLGSNAIYRLKDPVAAGSLGLALISTKSAGR
jgi:hypothetical protein